MYAITRLGKKVHTHGELSAIQAHNSRQMYVPNMAGPAKTVQLKGTGRLAVDVGALLPAKMRKNAVMAVEVLYTASPEYFRPANPSAAGTWQNDALQAWQSATMKYMIDRWGDRLVSATLHLDEATPHLHAIIVPIDERGRLNCRDVFNREALIRNQDDYAKATAHLGLIRGIEGSKAKHESVKQYYGRVIEPTPTLTTEIPPVPEPTPVERTKESLGFQTEHSRAVARAKDAKRKRSEEFKVQRAAERAKAAQYDAMKRREAANTRLLSRMRDEASLVREIALADVLVLMGAHPDPKDRNNWRTNAGRITVDGAKFFNHDAGKGGGGAIDLVMHLEGMSYRDTVSWLGGNIDKVAAVGSAMARAKVEALEATSTAPKVLAPPEPAAERWSQVRHYLIEVRKLGAAFVDKMHIDGKIYADRFSNAVFLNSNRSGCELRGTGEAEYHGQRGKKIPFTLPPKNDTRAALVESAIDALSLRELGFEGFILAFGGQSKTKLIETVHQLHEKGWQIVSAFDNDKAGQSMADDVEAALVGLATPFRMLPNGKDWNDDLRSSKTSPMTELTHKMSQQSSSNSVSGPDRSISKLKSDSELNAVKANSGYSSPVNTLSF